MASLALTLNTAEQTLINTQTELATSSNNISNANTPGYARQTAVQVENPEIPTTYGWAGAGASIQTISQTRDDFLEQQLMSATTSDSQYASLSTQQTTIQAAASDSGSNGISQALGNFFDSWSTLAQNPTGTSQQTTVYESAQNLANAVQSTYSQLNQISTQLPGQITDTVNQANTLINQISQLNTDILTSSSLGKPNNLIDQRYQDMDNLSKLIPVSFSTNADGSVNVSTTESGSTVSLVSGTATPVNIASSSGITGGQLGGLLQAQTNLNGYMTKFDNFAQTLATQVNSAFGSTIFSGSTASSITAGSGYLSGLSADALGVISQNMADLQDSASITFPDGSTSSLQGYLGNIQQAIGSDTQSAANNQSYYDALKSNLSSQQQSVSGISIDEEMVNVINFQQIYQAAAKVVQTTDTLMNTTINMVQ